MIRLEGLTKRYGSLTAVDAIHLEVRPGQIFGLLGPNGAGKTSTLRMIGGILVPDGGRVLLEGHDVVREPYAAKRRLGYVPDRPFLYEKLTGAEVLRFVAGLHGQSGPAVEQRIDELVGLWGLEEWRDELVETYSHGMRQKLILSAALVHRPSVLVIDEPMVGLDPGSARLLKDLMREFADRGGTLLISTHTLEFAEALCDRMAVIHQGRIVAEGSMEELREQAAGPGDRLEAVFLKLTGGAAEWELARILEA